MVLQTGIDFQEQYWFCSRCSRSICVTCAQEHDHPHRKFMIPLVARMWQKGGPEAGEKVKCSRCHDNVRCRLQAWESPFCLCKGCLDRGGELLYFSKPFLGKWPEIIRPQHWKKQELLTINPADCRCQGEGQRPVSHCERCSKGTLMYM